MLLNDPAHVAGLGVAQGNGVLGGVDFHHEAEFTGRGKRSETSVGALHQRHPAASFIVMILECT